MAPFRFTSDVITTDAVRPLCCLLGVDPSLAPLRRSGGVAIGAVHRGRRRRLVWSLYVSGVWLRARQAQLSHSGPAVSLLETVGVPVRQSRTGELQGRARRDSNPNLLIRREKEGAS
ncbi:hypothetical protein CLV30_10447 [Haloactinopolyspora alba]|uniref:Uncharacterized protein n=1 Tax=Haloactinopolyspora alba TaxID=648780 RepID=A0A2P8E6U5_9ACTN|nr:hypothetical protein CLV30_10447 [Haloactinopolyspora alba]